MYTSVNSYKSIMLGTNYIWTEHNTSHTVWKMNTESYTSDTELFIPKPDIPQYSTTVQQLGNRKVLIWCTRNENVFNYNVHINWNDKGNEINRPEQVTVTLLGNGTVYDTVKLTKDNGWKYTWNDLDGTSSWLAVTRDEITGYDCTDYVEDGIKVIKYTYNPTLPGDPPPPDNPPA